MFSYGSTSGGYRRKYFREEVVLLLRLMQVMLPLSDCEWQHLTREYNKRVPTGIDRTSGSLQRKYEPCVSTLERDTILRELALEIRLQLIEKSGISTGDSDYSSLNSLSTCDDSTIYSSDKEDNQLE